MRQRRVGTALIVIGTIGLVLMVVAAGLVVYQSRDVNDRADEILEPVAGAIQDFQAEVDTVEQLVDDLVEVLPTETVVDLAGQVSDFAARLAMFQGYIDGAERGLVALDAIPFLPVDLGDVSAELAGLDEGLSTLTAQVDEVTSFILENQDVPAQIADGVYSGIDQLRTGLDAAEAEIASVSDAADRWLLLGVAMTLVLLVFGIAGQIAMILWGRDKRQLSDDTSAASVVDDDQPAE
jgi:hypothetical protein